MKDHRCENDISATETKNEHDNEMLETVPDKEEYVATGKGLSYMLARNFTINQMLILFGCLLLFISLGFRFYVLRWSSAFGGISARSGFSLMFSISRSYVDIHRSEVVRWLLPLVTVAVFTVLGKRNKDNAFIALMASLVGSFFGLFALLPALNDISYIGEGLWIFGLLWTAIPPLAYLEYKGKHPFEKHSELLTSSCNKDTDEIPKQSHEAEARPASKGLFYVFTRRFSVNQRFIMAGCVLLLFSLGLNFVGFARASYTGFAWIFRPIAGLGIIFNIIIYVSRIVELLVPLVVVAVLSLINRKDKNSKRVVFAVSVIGLYFGVYRLLTFSGISRGIGIQLYVLLWMAIAAFAFYDYIGASLIKKIDFSHLINQERKGQGE
ncbi:MAG: hypothetical protein FWE42_06825 [Defluviitaleaceae bacterium]|nr:hypothetical protein [Defluviitaleaceae bacterium]